MVASRRWGRVVVQGAALLLVGCVAKPAPAPAQPVAPETAAAPSAGAPVAGQCLSPRALSTDFYGSANFPSAECRQAATERVARMTVMEKIGQMLQGGHDQLQNPADVVSRAMGSVLSGGGFGPQNPTPLEWAKLVQGYRAASLKTPLAIPILYG